MTRKEEQVKGAERMKPLLDHLAKIGARFLSNWYSVKKRGGPETLWQLYSTGKRCYLVEIMPGGDGWEVWKPVSDTNNVKQTLASIV